MRSFRSPFANFTAAVFEILIFLYLAYKVKDDKKRDLLTTIPLFALLFSLIVIYMIPGIITTELRLIFRLLIYILFLRYYSGTSFPLSIYLSLLSICIFNLCIGIMRIPLFENLNSAQVTIFGISYLDEFLCMTVIYVIVFSFFLLLIYIIPIYKIQNITLTHWVSMSLFTFCSVYSKNILGNAYMSGSLSEDVSVYAFLMYAFLYVALLLFERYSIISDEETKLQIQNLTNSYEVQSLEQRLRFEKETHAIYHDLRNHFMTINLFARNGDMENVLRYTEEGLKITDEIRSEYRTGSALLNVILSEKAKEAKTYGIEIDSELNLQNCRMIDNYDLCVIFTNLLDNAIEAVKDLKQEDKKITLKSTVEINILFFSVENRYEGSIHMINGLPVTKKNNKRFHGIGLSNVKKSIEKYGGDIEFRTEGGRFTAKAWIPMSTEKPY